MKNCCFSQKSPEKVDTSLEKSFEKVAGLQKKFLEKVVIKLGDYNVGREEQILTLPLYMAFLLTDV